MRTSGGLEQTPECVDGIRTLLRLRTYVRVSKRNSKRKTFENHLRKRNCIRGHFAEFLCVKTMVSNNFHKWCA